jgi:hypothetical protein
VRRWRWSRRASKHGSAAWAPTPASSSRSGITNTACFRKWQDDWTRSGPSDRDGLLYDAKRQWGAHLHIPLSYRTIEEMVPAAIAHRPRMLYLPRHEQWEHNVQNMRLLIDSQQENINIDLPFQAVMRSGRIFGLGIGKTWWRKEYEPAREVQAADVPAGAVLPEQAQVQVRVR